MNNHPSPATVIAPPCDCAAILPGFTFADCYAVSVRQGTDARDLVKAAFSSAPSWVRAFLNLRNRLGQLVGLKPAESKGFPVISESPQEVCVGFNDWHLDFRVVVTVGPEEGAATEAALSTIVRTHNFWGRAYLFLIMPFHRLIARRYLRGAAKKFAL